MPRPEQSLHPFDSVHRPDLRASDAEREQVVEALRSHGAEGRLGPEELSERLDEAYASSTLGQLQRALRELPERPPSPRPERSRLRPAALRVLPLLVLTVTIAAFAVAGLGFLWPLLFAAPWALGVARGGSPRAGFGPCGHKHRRCERAAAV